MPAWSEARGHSGPTPYRCPQPIFHTTMDGLQNSALESEIAKLVAFHQYLHSPNLSGSFLVSCYEETMGSPRTRSGTRGRVPNIYRPSPTMPLTPSHNPSDNTLLKRPDSLPQQPKSPHHASKQIAIPTPACIRRKQYAQNPFSHYQRIRLRAKSLPEALAIHPAQPPSPQPLI